MLYTRVSLSLHPRSANLISWPGGSETKWKRNGTVFAFFLPSPFFPPYQIIFVPSFSGSGQEVSHFPVGLSFLSLSLSETLFGLASFQPSSKATGRWPYPTSSDFDRSNLACGRNAIFFPLPPPFLRLLGLLELEQNPRKVTQQLIPFLSMVMWLVLFMVTRSGNVIC